MLKTIVIAGTLDTKGNEVRYLKQQIEEKGHNTIVVDVGVLSKPLFEPDIKREEVAEAGGAVLQNLVTSALGGADRAKATEIMMKGVSKIVRELYSAGKLDGIISLGGGTGTAIGTAAMRVLPIGLPKLMVSTLVGMWDISRFVNGKDITMMNSVVDIFGLNMLTRRTLANAAGAIVGMVEVEFPKEKLKPLIGITCLGVTTPAVMKSVELLERRGYEVVVFHSPSTMQLKDLIEEGMIDGLIDMSPYELIPQFIYRIKDFPEVGEDRLEWAGKKGIPQIIVPGAFDMIIFGGTKDNLPLELKKRKMHKHGPTCVLVRTTKKELAELGRIVAEKANSAVGPTVIAIPLRGFSSVDKEGQALYDPQANRAFVKALKNKVQEHIKVVEISAHINDVNFAEEVVAIFDGINKKG